MFSHNGGNRIQDVVTRSACNVHGAHLDEPCWVVYPLGGRESYRTNIAVCGTRIKSAGFVGAISPFSLRKTQGPNTGHSKR